MADVTPFYRMGEPFRIPVSPTSGTTVVQLAIPKGATSFRIANPNPFSVRLRGLTAKQKAAGQVLSVDASNGWLFMPGAVEVYGSVQPVELAVIAVDGPMAAFDLSQKAGTGIFEMQYGSGA